MHLGAGPMPKETIDKVQTVFNEHSADWLRYAPNCWVIFSSESSKVWATRMHELIGTEEELLVFPVDIDDFYGWASEVARDWLKKYRAP